MDEREFESMLKRLLNQDFSAGTEAFRDKLLARCLEVLDVDSRTTGNIIEFGELTDADLDLLAAAGDIYSSGNSAHIVDNGTLNN